MSENTTFQREITRFLPDISLKFQEPLSRHTSFRIGGAAQVMAFPRSEGELAQLLCAAAQLSLPVRILGGGTNILAPDEGVSGLVICLKNALIGHEDLGGGTIRVYAGETMTNAAIFAAELGLSGLEFAHGIPGTVGGGVYMNAGAYGGEIRQVCTAVAVMDFAGNSRVLSGDEMEFCYRGSVLQRENAIVLYADFTLRPQPKEEILDLMQQLKAKRSASQPLDKPSAGSAFKRPVGGYAAALIDQAGLKGYQVGGAAISSKHAGFAVNLGGATAADVKSLLRQVSDRVFEQSGIRLEPEIRIW